MNLSQTVDAAAQLIAHADHIIKQPQLLEDGSLHSYWVYSRDMTNSWMQNLAVCQKVLQTGTQVRQRQCWLEYEPDLRDVFRADILHRVWFTILKAADVEQNARHAEPIARSVLAAQLQVRIRCLKLILAGHQIDAARMRTLNEMRKNSEMWSDFLCGHLASKYQIDDVLFDSQRAHTWGEQPLSEVFPELKLYDQSPASADLNWNLIAEIRKGESLNPLQVLVRKMLNCFPETAFDPQGLLRNFKQN
ncbi:hypothetical protein [uncultured Rubinisphaera sp.]|uniref:hypothetical protein n=1 Tax=uncultured Rubinisphaera sp. TaxID=1678686 RepID=UPI0030D9DC85